MRRRTTDEEGEAAIANVTQHHPDLAARLPLEDALAATRATKNLLSRPPFKTRPRQKHPFGGARRANNKKKKNAAAKRRVDSGRSDARKTDQPRNPSLENRRARQIRLAPLINERENERRGGGKKKKKSHNPNINKARARR